MSGSAAKSGGPSPYYAPGMGSPFDGLNTLEAPQGLRPREFKRAVEFSEVEESPDRSKAKMMET
eukprot:2037831-Karenia_brevis.AAC.1